MTLLQPNESRSHIIQFASHTSFRLDLGCGGGFEGEGGDVVLDLNVAPVALGNLGPNVKTT